MSFSGIWAGVAQIIYAVLVSISMPKIYRSLTVLPNLMPCVANEGWAGGQHGQPNPKAKPPMALIALIPIKPDTARKCSGSVQPRADDVLLRLRPVSTTLCTRVYIQHACVSRYIYIYTHAYTHIHVIHPYISSFIYTSYQYSLYLCAFVRTCIYVRT